MRNATIATSRTRATADHLINYRPLPATWGDLESLQEVRAAKSRAAARGLDPSTLEITASSRRPAPLSTATHRGSRGLLASLLGGSGGHHRPRHVSGRLAAV